MSAIYIAHIIMLPPLQWSCKKKQKHGLTVAKLIEVVFNKPILSKYTLISICFRYCVVCHVDDRMYRKSIRNCDSPLDESKQIDCMFWFPLFLISIFPPSLQTIFLFDERIAWHRTFHIAMNVNILCVLHYFNLVSADPATRIWINFNWYPEMKNGLGQRRHTSCWTSTGCEQTANMKISFKTFSDKGSISQYAMWTHHSSRIHTAEKQEIWEKGEKPHQCGRRGNAISQIKRKRLATHVELKCTKC